MVKRKLPKGGDLKFGRVLVTPDTYDISKKYPIIIVGHGIGERGDGSDIGLDKIFKWGGFDTPGDQQSLMKATDKWDFIALFIQTINNYEFGEIQDAIAYAKTNLPIEPKQIYYMGVSLGMFGFYKNVDSDPTLLSNLAAIVSVASGPGTSALTGDRIAASGVPIQMFHAKDDNVAPFSISKNLFDDIKANGGNAWLTEYDNGQHSIFTRVSKGFNALWLPVGGPFTATGLIPKISAYEFLLANGQGGSPVSPIDPYVRFVPTPPLPTKQLLFTLNVFNDGTTEKV